MSSIPHIPGIQDDSNALLAMLSESKSSALAVGTRIAHLRKSKEITQATLAKHVGVSQQTIGAIEAARVTDPRHLPAIAQVLGVSAEYLKYGRQAGVPLLTRLSVLSDIPTPGVDLDHSQRYVLPTEKKALKLGFAAYAMDDAMKSYGIPSGALVIINPDIQEVPGDVLAVLYGGRMTLRHFVQEEANSEPKYVPSDEHHPTLNAAFARSIGVVVEYRVMRK